MKKLTKILLVLGIALFAVTISTNKLLAEETKQDPQQVEIIGSDETPSEDEYSLPEVNVSDDLKDGLPKTEDGDEIEDINGKILDHDGLEDQDITIIEIVEDLEHPDLPGQTVITETTIDNGEEEIEKHIISKDELIVNPDDIGLLIEPKFTEEVANVSAIAIDKDNLQQWIIDKLDWLNITGLKDKDIIKLKIDDTDETKGTWVIETPEISYDIYTEYKGLKVVGYYIKAQNGSGDYDKIYLHVFTEEMNIDEGVKNDEGGLDINNIELAVPDGGTSEEVTIFDPGHIENYVNGYGDVYDDIPETVYKKNWLGILKEVDEETVKEAAEGLTIENVRIKNTDGSAASGLTATVNADGSVSVYTDTVGTYDVYLEGWYTQKRYLPVAGIKNYLLNDLPAGEYYREIDGEFYKIEYTPKDGKAPAKTVWYKLVTNSAWATFADIKVNAVATETPIYIENHDSNVGNGDDTGSREWVVVKEVVIEQGEELPENLPEELKEDITEIEAVIGEDKEVFFFDINLYEQMFQNGKAIGAATEIHAVGGDENHPETTVVRISGKLETPVSENNKPDFKVISRHNGTIIYPEIKSVDYNEQTGEWTIEFYASLFSTYAVTYDIVPKQTSHGYRIVNTGITACQETTTNHSMKLLVVCALVALIGLNKKRTNK